MPVLPREWATQPVRFLKRDDLQRPLTTRANSPPPPNQTLQVRQRRLRAWRVCAGNNRKRNAHMQCGPRMPWLKLTKPAFATKDQAQTSRTRRRPSRRTRQSEARRPGSGFGLRCSLFSSNVQNAPGPKAWRLVALLFHPSGELVMNVAMAVFFCPTFSDEPWLDATPTLFPAAG
jgi:hypothetical protein